ncbi:MAG: 50S ribosomal protein L17 [Opitutaceae bacterium]|jgi:large subunit ribosomal protein L17
MRHKKHHATLGVTREHRRAMMSNLAAALITHGRIQTTLAKAKALRPFVEKVITKAKKAAGKTDKKDALHLRRLALRDVRDEDAVTLLFNEKHKEFANRNGGYTRIYKLGPQRISDAAELALIEFVKAEDTGYSKSKGRRPSKGRKAPKAKAGESAEAAPAGEGAAAAKTAAETAPAGGEAPQGGEKTAVEPQSKAEAPADPGDGVKS